MTRMVDRPRWRRGSPEHPGAAAPARSRPGPEPSGPGLDAAGLVLAGSAFLILAATSIRYNRPDPVLLVLMLLGLAATVAAACLRRTGAWSRPASRLVGPITWLTVLGCLALYLYRSRLEIGWQALPTWPLWVQAGIVLAVLASYATGRGVAARWRFPVVAIVQIGMGLWVILGWSAPVVDVYWLQQDACRQLAEGVDPYGAEHPGIPWNPRFDGDPVRAGDHLRSFPYPPLSLLLVMPGWWLGDVRLVLLAGMVLTAWTAVAAGRRAGRPAGDRGELWGIALLHYPMALRIVYNAWTEPLQSLAIAGCAWSLLGGRAGLAGLGLGALSGFKQFGFLGLPPFLAAGRLRLRDLAAGLAAVGVLTLPFALWDLRAFWLGNLEYHLSSRNRPDSLSIVAYLIDHGVAIPASVGFLATALVLVPVLARRDGSIGRATLGSAAGFLAFFLFGKAAHANYLWLVAAMLVLAVLVSPVPPPDRSDRSGPAFGRARGRDEASV